MIIFNNKMATAKKNYVILKEFNNSADCDIYRTKLFRHGIIHSQNVNCQNCVEATHKMKVQYIKCSNKECVRDDIGCTKRYKIQTCLKTNEIERKVVLFKLSTHNTFINHDVHYGKPNFAVNTKPKE